MTPFLQNRVILNFKTGQRACVAAQSLAARVLSSTPLLNADVFVSQELTSVQVSSSSSSGHLCLIPKTLAHPVALESDPGPKGAQDRPSTLASRRDRSKCGNTERIGDFSGGSKRKTWGPAVEEQAANYSDKNRPHTASRTTKNFLSM